MSEPKFIKPEWAPWNDDPEDYTGFYDKDAMDAYLVFLQAERDKLLAEREQYKTLYNAASARVDDYCDLLKKVQSHSPISPSGDLVYDKLQSENKRLRTALEKIVAGLSEKGPRQIAEEALK